MAFVNPPSWVPPVSQNKFFLPQPPGTVPSTPFVEEEDNGWWGGVQQAGAFVALAFALEASALSANTAIQFQAQHQDEISRGPVIEEVYSYQSLGSLPVLDTSYPAYVAPHQDEISRGPVIDEIYQYKEASSIEPVFLPRPYWFDPNEISRGPIVDEVYDYKSAPTIDPVQTLLNQWNLQQDEYPTQVATPIAYEDYWLQVAVAISDNPYLLHQYIFDSGDGIFVTIQTRFVPWIQEDDS